MKRFAIIIGLIFAINQLFGQSIVTDRPDQTESSSTIKKGSLQIESGVLLSYTNIDNAIERQILAPTTLFRYGLASKFELRVLSQFETLRNNGKVIQGISDLEIGTKIQLLQKESINTEIAFLSHLILPTGTKELRGIDYGTINKLSVSHELNEQIELGYNIGYNYFGVEKGDLTYSIALGVGVSDKVGVYIEPYGDWVNFTDLEANFDAGFTYLVNPNFQLDFSFGTGLNYEMNYLSIGFSWITF